MQSELSSPLGHILFVDDDADVLKAANLLLPRNGIRMSPARSPAEAWSVMASEPVDAVLLDLNFTRGASTGEEGFQCLTEIMSQDPDAVVVVVTGHSGVNIAVKAMRAGASDFVMKPWSNDRLVTTLQGALKLRRQRREAAAVKAQGRPSDGDAPPIHGPILGESSGIQRVRDLIRRTAGMDAAVLIYGEAGTGKSLIARTIHLKSARSSGPFISVDLGALSEREAEIAFFGAECGGEGEGRPGAFTKAQGGTLVLDEIGALTPTLQTKLLSVLETGFCPDGGARVDVRLISATRRLRQDVRDRLQDDLLYRLNTVEISVPPPRDRGGDIELLAAHFLRLYANRYARAVKVLSPEAAAAVREAPWPGEVRALRQAMERCVIFAEGAQIEIADLPLFDEADPVSSPRRSGVKLIESERALISGVLKRHNFNVSHAAKQLGLSRAALYRRMAKHGL